MRVRRQVHNYVDARCLRDRETTRQFQGDTDRETERQRSHALMMFHISVNGYIQLRKKNILTRAHTLDEDKLIPLTKWTQGVCWCLSA